MKFRHFIIALVAAVICSAACRETEPDLSFPAISTVTSEALTFDQTAGSKTISFLANRAWKATSDADWVAIDPAEGEGSDEAQTVTVTVLDNSSWDREAKVTIDIVYDTQTYPVAQAGKGSAAYKILYFNDFDKETSSQTYGDKKNSWPYPDQFEGWKNQTGQGTEGVSYDFSSVSVRSNSPSNGTYSDYEGSGANNILFGTGAFFRINRIALNGNTDIVMSFGTEKYLADDKTALFNPSELPFYVSVDGEKWVSVDYSYAGTAAGRWNLASAAFAVPAGTDYLYVHIASILSGAHRIDDLRLELSEEPCSLLDFSKGIEIGTGSGPDTGEGTGEGIEVTCAEAAALCDALSSGGTSSETYSITGYITDVYSNVSKGQQSFWMADTADGGKILQAYWANLPSGVSSFTKGSKVKITGKLLKYVNSSSEVVPEVKNADVEILETGTGGDVPDTPPSGEAKHVTIAEFLSRADADTPYELTGKVTNIKNTTYGNFDLVDETGSVYIYGLLDAAGKAQNFAGMGISAGDVLTLTGVYTEYAGTAEIKNAQFISVQKGGGSVDPDTPDTGGDGSGNSKTIVTNSSSQTWTAVTDGTYGSGFTSTTDGVTVSYYKYKSTTTPVTAQSDHIRVYKDSWLSISVAGASKITRIVITSAYADKCFDLSVSDGSVAKSDTNAKTVTWNGSIAQFGAQSTGGQNRIKSIEVTYE